MFYFVIFYIFNFDKFVVEGGVDMSGLCCVLCDVMFVVCDEQDWQVFFIGGMCVLVYFVVYSVVFDGGVVGIVVGLGGDYVFVYMNVCMV